MGCTGLTGEVLPPLQRHFRRSGNLWCGITGISFAGVSFTGLSRSAGHHDLCAAPGASATPAASHTDSRRILGHKHLLGVLADNLGGDVGHEGAEADEAAVRRERPAAEASSVVADEVQRAESVDKATDHALVGGDDGTRPDEHTSQRRCWPHGGRQLSWWYHGRCHRMAKVWGRWTLVESGRGLAR